MSLCSLPNQSIFQFSNLKTMKKKRTGSMKLPYKYCEENGSMKPPAKNERTELESPTMSQKKRTISTSDQHLHIFRDLVGGGGVGFLF